MNTAKRFWLRVPESDPTLGISISESPVQTRGGTEQVTEQVFVPFFV
jgi:hypothetical protein